MTREFLSVEDYDTERMEHARASRSLGIVRESEDGPYTYGLTEDGAVYQCRHTPVRIGTGNWKAFLCGHWHRARLSREEIVRLFPPLPAPEPVEKRASAPREVVVTRHPALVAYLREIGLISPDAEVVTHATPELVRRNHVIGVLPLRLAALTASITEVPLNLPPELRGQELSLEQVRQYAGEPQTYEVCAVDRD